MPDADRQTGTRFWKFAALALGFVAAFIIGYVTAGIVTYLNSLAPEYNSAQAIGDVTDFVRANDTWPTSWNDLDRPPLEGVSVNWSLDIDSCDRHDVMTAIVPALADTRPIHTLSPNSMPCGSWFGIVRRFVVRADPTPGDPPRRVCDS